MAIAAGTRLGPYEVVAPLGAGGMGEVWRARDTRLDRSVAIKVLPAEFADNAQLKTRFEREAKTISQLNHPHICTLYDVGDGYLVMELLEGESLADRLSKGPLTVSETLRVGAQVADALDRAHRAGVVHRDLKPGNVMLTKSGAKLLDFGLAKAMDSGALMFDGATQQKPLTQEGTILGTFQYMAPEQLEGLEADPRTDIFALGALLYEMATGRRAFQGTSKTSLIAAIVSAEPQPISMIQPLTPPAFEHVVKKCLAKDRDARWQSAYDVAEELRWISEAGSQAGVASPVVMHRRRVQTLSWIAALIGIASLVGAIAWFAAARWTVKHQTHPSYRLTIATPAGSILGYHAGPMALSPDGQMLTYASYSSDGNKLLVRKLSELAWRPLEGTTGAMWPFWSPDGKQIAYFSKGSLWKVAADGSSAPEQITKVLSRGVAQGSWNAHGVIVFGNAHSLYRVPASGGEPSVLIDGGANFLRVPFFLPDGVHFLYSSTAPDGKTSHLAASLDEKAAGKKLVEGDNIIVYSNGFAFYVRNATVYGQPFDLKKLTLGGEPIAMAKVQSYTADAAYFSVANDAFVYLPLGSEVRTELQRVDRTGKTLGTTGQSAFYFSPRLSRDGKRIAVDESASDGPGDIWILDVTNDTSTRFTFAPQNDSAPIWAPGDSDIAFFTEKDGSSVVARKHSAGGEPAIVFDSGPVAYTSDWSPDGKTFLAMVLPPKASRLSIVALSLPEWKATASLGTGQGGRFSPDGKWIAYSTFDESRATDEVFVQPFPLNGSKWQVSIDGGHTPVWRRDGKAIYFINNAGKLCESLVSTNADGTFAAQPPQPLFGVAVREGGLQWAQYDVFPDGTFLLNRIPDSSTTPISVVLNWKDSLKTP